MKQYDEILKVRPGHRGALLGRGDVQVAKGDLKGVASPFERIVNDSKAGKGGEPGSATLAVGDQRAERPEEHMPDGLP